MIIIIIPMSESSSHLLYSILSQERPGVALWPSDDPMIRRYAKSYYLVGLDDYEEGSCSREWVSHHDHNSGHKNNNILFIISHTRLLHRHIYSKRWREKMMKNTSGGVNWRAQKKKLWIDHLWYSISHPDSHCNNFRGPHVNLLLTTNGKVGDKKNSDKNFPKYKFWWVIMMFWRGSFMDKKLMDMTDYYKILMLTF